MPRASLPAPEPVRASRGDRDVQRALPPSPVPNGIRTPTFSAVCWQELVLPHAQDAPRICPSYCIECVMPQQENEQWICALKKRKKKVQVKGYKSQRLARNEREDRAPKKAATPALSGASFLWLQESSISSQHQRENRCSSNSLTAFAVHSPFFDLQGLRVIILF